MPHTTLVPDGAKDRLAPTGGTGTLAYPYTIENLAAVPCRLSHSAAGAPME